MKHIFSIIIAVLLFLPSLAFTQTKEIIAEGAYNMGDGETPSVAEERALVQAKRTALEQAGTYVESYSKVKNFQLTEDEIKVIASGLMEVEILDRKRTVIGDGFHFWVKIKARVNLDKTEEMANKIKVKDKSFVEDYKKVQEAYDKSQREIEELKKQLAKAKNEKEKKQVEVKITDDERFFQAREWFEKGNGRYLNGQYDMAIENYNKAVALYPSNFASAKTYIIDGNEQYTRVSYPEIAGTHNNRGLAYYNKGQYDSAIEDFNKVIALNPNYADAYYNRGLAYYNKRQYDSAIEDFNKVIALDPNDAEAYYNLGYAYAGKGQLDKAVENYNKAIALNPNLANAYYNLGLAYGKKGQFDQAIKNLNKAIAINPNLADAYYALGAAYGVQGQFDRAIENLNKAIALAPNNANAYGALGLAYDKKGDTGRAISHFKKACDMGDENGCKNLQDLKKR